MSELYSVECTVHERNIIIGTLENVRWGLGVEGHSAEADEYSAISDEVWEHTSPPAGQSSDIPLDSPVTVSLTPRHWFLVAGLLDTSAFRNADPQESQVNLRVRDRITERLGDALPAPAQPSAPQRRQAGVPIGELGFYELYSAWSTGGDRFAGMDRGHDAWIGEGNGLLVRSHILTGTRDGTVDVTVELLNGPPPLETGPWDDVAEASSRFSTVGIPGPPPEANKLIAAAPGRDGVALLQLDPVWPSGCMYRVRVSVRGRDEGTSEQHLIQLWRAPSAPEELIKATDLTGRRRRPERPAAAQQPPADSDIRAWANSNRIPINEYGRIPAHMVAKYEAAHRTEDGNERPT
ncbi:Lsr2 family protein [Spirillospora sp. NBC_00431]